MPIQNWALPNQSRFLLLKRLMTKRQIERWLSGRPDCRQIGFSTYREWQIEPSMVASFVTPNGRYMDMSIDAVNGKVLLQQDLTVSCSFKRGQKHSHKPEFNFHDLLFNTASSSAMVVNPGTYRVIPANYESPAHHGFELITTPERQ
jgi:hypothetical protein